MHGLLWVPNLVEARGRQREDSMEERQVRLLRRAFLLGAITDALALIPMLVPWNAKLLWGFTDPWGGLVLTEIVAVL